MSDGPTQFKNESVQRVTNGLEVPHHFALPYTLWTTGAEERLGKEVLKTFRSVLSELQHWSSKWFDLVPILQSMWCMVDLFPLSAPSHSQHCRNYFHHQVRRDHTRDNRFHHHIGHLLNCNDCCHHPVHHSHNCKSCQELRGTLWLLIVTVSTSISKTADIRRVPADKNSWFVSISECTIIIPTLSDA